VDYRKQSEVHESYKIGIRYAAGKPIEDAMDGLDGLPMN
jgi:hypothetical protein